MMEHTAKTPTQALKGAAREKNEPLVFECFAGFGAALALLLDEVSLCLSEFRIRVVDSVGLRGPFGGRKIHFSFVY